MTTRSVLKIFQTVILIATLACTSHSMADCISPDASAQGQSLPEGYRFPSGGSWYECKDNVWQKGNAVTHPRPYSEDKSGSCLPLGRGFETRDGVVSMTYKEEKSRHSFFGKVHECVNGNWWQLPAGKVPVENTAPPKALAPKPAPVTQAKPAIPEYPDDEPEITAPQSTPAPVIDPIKQLEALEQMEARPVPRSPAKEVVSPAEPSIPDYAPAPAPALKASPAPSAPVSIPPKLPPGSAEAPDRFEHSEDFKQCLANCTEGRDEGERAGIYKCKLAGFEKYGNTAWPEEGVKAFNACRILAARKAKNQLNACLLPCRKQAQQYIWEGN